MREYGIIITIIDTSEADPSLIIAIGSTFVTALFVYASPAWRALRGTAKPRRDTVKFHRRLPRSRRTPVDDIDDDDEVGKENQDRAEILKSGATLNARRHSF